MKHGILCLTLMAFILSAFIFLPQNAPAQEAKAFTPDKALCAEMIRFGKQSYQRGKFAEKVNKDTGLIAPDVSPQGSAKAGVAAPPPPAPKPAPAKKKRFVVEEDEGC